MFEPIKNIRNPHYPPVRVSDASEICGCDRTDFYSIIIAQGDSAPSSKGKQHDDYQDGVAYFIPPGTSCKAFSQCREEGCLLNGRGLFFHQGLLTDTPLEDIEATYSFFRYRCRNEALHLSAGEKQIMDRCLDDIDADASPDITDELSTEIIINRLELLLNYSKRFYKTQFILRHERHCRIVELTDGTLRKYFLNPCEDCRRKLPSASDCARQSNVSQAYLEDIIMNETGKTWLEFIHERQSELAGQELLRTGKSLTQIARQMGYPSLKFFNEQFRKTHGCTPAEYRSR